MNPNRHNVQFRSPLITRRLNCFAQVVLSKKCIKTEISCSNNAAESVSRRCEYIIIFAGGNMLRNATAVTA